MEMADEKTWRCFIIGEKERAKKQNKRQEGKPAHLQVALAAWLFVRPVTRTHTAGAHPPLEAYRSKKEGIFSFVCLHDCVQFARSQ